MENFDLSIKRLPVSVYLLSYSPVFKAWKRHEESHHLQVVRLDMLAGTTRLLLLHVAFVEETKRPVWDPLAGQTPNLGLHE